MSFCALFVQSALCLYSDLRLTVQITYHYSTVMLLITSVHSLLFSSFLFFLSFITSSFSKDEKNSLILIHTISSTKSSFSLELLGQRRYYTKYIKTTVPISYFADVLYKFCNWTFFRKEGFSLFPNNQNLWLLLFEPCSTILFAIHHFHYCLFRFFFLLLLVLLFLPCLVSLRSCRTCERAGPSAGADSAPTLTRANSRLSAAKIPLSWR